MSSPSKTVTAKYFFPADPEARLSKTTETMMRVPDTHALPWQTIVSNRYSFLPVHRISHSQLFFENVISRLIHFTPNRAYI